MIPYETYKVLHILGVLLTFAVLGGLALTVANGATKSTSQVRRLIGATHGIGTFIILLGGFGALARLGVMHGAGLPLSTVNPSKQKRSRDSSRCPPSVTDSVTSAPLSARSDSAAQSSVSIRFTRVAVTA